MAIRKQNGWLLDDFAGCLLDACWMLAGCLAPVAPLTIYGLFKGYPLQISNTVQILDTLSIFQTLSASHRPMCRLNLVSFESRQNSDELICIAIENVWTQNFWTAHKRSSNDRESRFKKRLRSVRELRASVNNARASPGKMRVMYACAQCTLYIIHCTG